MYSLTLDNNNIKARHRLFRTSDDVVTALPLNRGATEETGVAAMRTALAEAEDKLMAQEERIRQLEGLALSDELTGVLNRRGFMTTIQRELSSARRNKSASGALIMVDLDRFKMINDTWGHTAGDAYLRSAANSLLANVRTNDFVARLGGDEFAVVLTRISRADASQRLLDITRNFNCQVAEWEEFAMPLRGSFGMSYFDGAKDCEHVMADADMKLYAQKGERRRNEDLIIG